MSQPDWEFVANLGDANPLEEGGFFVYRDKTGVYPPEAEMYDPERRQAWRLLLEPLHSHRGILVPAKIAADFRHKTGRPLLHEKPLGAYEEWFSKSIEYVARQNGLQARVLRRLLCSNDILERAAGYKLLADALGYHNFDPDGPLQLESHEDAAYRYQKEVNRLDQSFCPLCRGWFEWQADRNYIMDHGGCRDCAPEEDPEEALA